MGADCGGSGGDAKNTVIGVEGRCIVQDLAANAVFICENLRLNLRFG